MDDNTRRSFIKGSILLGAAMTIPAKDSAYAFNHSIGSSDMKILFQGDSITDGNRSRDNDWNHVMGHGYQYIVSSKLWYEHPDRKFHFFNRGISGNKVTDLAARWQTDALEIKPDVLSILVGVNDANEAVKGNLKFTAQSYKEGYRELIDRSKSENPNLKLVIGESFLLPVGAVKANWERWTDEVAQRQVIAKDIAREFNATFVPYQTAFNESLKRAPAEYWIWDGIHPMPAGHELMAREWLKAVTKARLL
ncbi:MAG: SGNH/GDSL hydrolase family protein [Pedobacter sp.]